MGIATVSRVLNQSTLVAPAKTEKVLQAIQAVGYKLPLSLSNASAGRAKARPTKLKHQAVCLLLIGHRTLRWITDCAPVHAYVIEGAESSLRSMKVDCMIRHVQEPADLESLKGMPVDGFLIHGAGDWNEWPPELRAYPGISMLGQPASGWGDCVTYNNVSTGKLAADYLLSKGCRHVAIAGSTGGGIPGGIFAIRREAFSTKMTVSGATVLDLSNTHLMQPAPDIQMPNEEVLRACVDQFLASSPRPDGLFITSDVAAPPLYREFERRGVVLGVDIPVVSCNNEKSYLSQLKNQPAVVDIQSGQIGVRAIESLFWRLQNPNALRQSILLEPILYKPRP